MISVFVTGILFVITFIISGCKIAQRDIPTIHAPQKKSMSLHTIQPSQHLMR